MPRLRRTALMSAAGLIALLTLGTGVAHGQGDWGPGANMQPVKILGGPHTGLEGPNGIAFDDAGRMYVTNPDDRSVAVYSANWASGDTTPLKVLRGGHTLLIKPVAIAFDDSQQMYVVNSDSITVYPADWASGDTAPIKSLRGGGTGLVSPQGIAFDSVGRMYVTNNFEIVNIRLGSVTVYEPDWPSGSTEPIATLMGNSTGLIRPSGITFDTQGLMYVTEAYGVSVYAAGWDSGDTPPLKILTGPGSGMAEPRGITIDDQGYMYVANAGRGIVDLPYVSIHAPNWPTGDVPPVGLVYGAESRITTPHGIAFDPAGLLYVTDRATNIVTTYATQTLAVDPVGSVPWSTPTVTVSASASSGLAVTIKTTNPLVCEGEGTSPLKVTVKTMGTCTFIATQAGDDTWLPAPKVSGAFSVTAAPQTITVTAQGDVPLSKEWVRMRASTSSGLPVIWSSQTPSVCVPKRGFGQRVQLRSVGTCTLTASQPGNRLWYSAPSVTTSFEVTS